MKFNEDDSVIIGDSIRSYSGGIIPPGTYVVVSPPDGEGDVGISKSLDDSADFFVHKSKLRAISTAADAAAQQLASSIFDTHEAQSSDVKNGGFVLVLDGAAYVVSVEKFGGDA